MSISSISPSSGTQTSQTASAAPAVDSAPQSTQPSSIVTLSEQGKKLSQSNANAQSNPSQTPNTANNAVKAVPKEANQPPGIQLIAGDMKYGRISTYA